MARTMNNTDGSAVSKSQATSIEQAYFNLRIVSYLVMHDALGFGGKRIVNFEKIMNKYLDSYDNDGYPTNYFVDQMGDRGINIPSLTREIPLRQCMVLAFGSRIPKWISPKDVSAIRMAIQMYLAISSYILHKDMRVSLKNIDKVYVKDIILNIACLAEKNRLQIEDIVYVLADECNYLDPRYMLEPAAGGSYTDGRKNCILD